MAMRVLVMDDNAVDLEFVVALLERMGSRALTAKTAEGGFLLAIEERPDLILMGLRLHGMTDYEAIRRLKRDPAHDRYPRGSDHSLRPAGR